MGVLFGVRLSMVWVAYPRLVDVVPEYAWSNNDGYDRIAMNWVKDGIYALHPGVPTALRAPLYPLLNALAILAAGPAYPSIVMLVQALLSVWTGWLIYRLAADALGHAPAWLALSLFILNPHVNNFVFRCATETLFLHLVTGWLFHLARYARAARRRHLLFSAVYAGLAYLTRSTLGVLPLLLYPWVALCAVRVAARPRRIAVDFGLALAVLGVLLGPWTVRNFLHTGRWPVLQTWVGRPIYQGVYVSEHVGAFLRGNTTLTKLDEAAFREVTHRTRETERAARAAGHSPVRVEHDADRHGRRLALQKLRADLPGTARRWLRNLFLAPVLQMTWRGTWMLVFWNTPLLFLSFGGLALQARERRETLFPLLPVIVTFGYVVSLHALAWPQARYVMPALIPFTIFAGLASARLMAGYSTRREYVSRTTP